MALIPSKNDVRVSQDVLQELCKAKLKHNPMHSAHEGKAVIEEEFEELWDEIKKQKPDIKLMRAEAIQVAAMAMRFVIDVCDGEKEKPSYGCGGGTLEGLRKGY